MKRSRKGRKLSDETKKKIGLANSIALKGKKLPEEVKRKISENSSRYWLGKERIDQRGENHHNWQGGKSFESYSLDWTETLKRSIRERDNYICQLCSQYGHEVHHIDYNKKNNSPNNLICLCKKCHAKTNWRNRDDWTNYLKELMKKLDKILEKL